MSKAEAVRLPIEMPQKTRAQEASRHLGYAMHHYPLSETAQALELARFCGSFDRKSLMRPLQVRALLNDGGNADLIDRLISETSNDRGGEPMEPEAMRDIVHNRFSLAHQMMPLGLEDMGKLLALYGRIEAIGGEDAYRAEVFKQVKSAEMQQVRTANSRARATRPKRNARQPLSRH